MTTAAPAAPLRRITETPSAPAPAPAATPGGPPNLASAGGTPCRWKLLVGGWAECRPHGHVWPPQGYRTGKRDHQGYLLRGAAS